MSIRKSDGVTESERFLAHLCDNTFLKLWNYPNPYKDDGKELCDLLVIFEDTAFVFFDRTKPLAVNSDKDPLVQWHRWKRKVIDAQIRTASGAQRYIASGRLIYLDNGLGQQLPIPSRPRLIHKVIVAHGAAEACEAASDANVYGSLAICYQDMGSESGQPDMPFFVSLDRSDPVHIFDTHNLPIILGELDTVWDLSDYLEAKNSAISEYQMLTYYDEDNNKHFIGTKDDDITGVAIGEGEWRDFVNSDTYQRTKRDNDESYLWDRLLQKTSESALNGVLLGYSPLFERRSAIHEMAKEPRFSRRDLAKHMLTAIEKFPEPEGKLVRNISLMPSIEPGKRYSFLQFWAPEEIRKQDDYREKRQTLLERACGAAKNKFPDIKIMVGIAVDAPKYAAEVAEDFLLMDCSKWDEEHRRRYEELNEGFAFFDSGVSRYKSPRHGSCQPSSYKSFTVKVAKYRWC